MTNNKYKETKIYDFQRIKPGTTVYKRFKLFRIFKLFALVNINVITKNCFHENK